MIIFKLVHIYTDRIKNSLKIKFLKRVFNEKEILKCKKSIIVLTVLQRFARKKLFLKLWGLEYLMVLVLTKLLFLIKNQENLYKFNR